MQALSRISQSKLGRDFHIPWMHGLDKAPMIMLGFTAITGVAKMGSFIYSVSTLGAAHPQLSIRAVAGEKKISYALATFKLDCRRNPTKKEGLKSLLIRPALVADLWNGPYLEISDLFDPWGREYHYHPIGKRYSISSYGADGKHGGRGDDSDLVLTR